MRRSGSRRTTPVVVRRLRCLRTRVTASPSASASSAAVCGLAGERTGDRQPLRVGQRAQDLIGGLGHVGSYPYHAGMQLTDPQRRTLEQLIGTEARPTFPVDLCQRLRDRIEEAVRELELPDAAVAGQGEAHGPRALRGEVRRGCLGGGAAVRALGQERRGRALAQGDRGGGGGARGAATPIRSRRVAADRLVEREERFAEYWRGLDAHGSRRGPDGGRKARDHVPGVVPAAQGAAPRADAHPRDVRCKAELLGGALVLSGRIDLVLGSAGSPRARARHAPGDRPEDGQAPIPNTPRTCGTTRCS